MRGKLVIFSAPSGAGKTSIVRALLSRMPELEFSVSACSRPMRPGEADGVDYYFLTPEDFREKIAQGLFLEWEEVYPGSYYGTLISEVERIWAKDKHVIFDVDVAGGINIKEQYADKALSIFVMPPSIDELRNRLLGRKTETQESLAKRINKAEQELGYAKQFDRVVVNDKLEDAIHEAEKLLKHFLDLK
jgi:guanylate kinase